MENKCVFIIHDLKVVLSVPTNCYQSEGPGREKGREEERGRKGRGGEKKGLTVHRRGMMGTIRGQPG